MLYTVVWRTAGTLSNVAVAGVAGRLSVADVLAIARRQDARVRAAVETGGARPDRVATSDSLYTSERTGR